MRSDAQFLGRGKLFWMNIHRFSAVVFTLAALTHLGLHWKCLTGACKRYFARSPRRAARTDHEQAVMLMALVAVIVASFTAWFSLPDDIPTLAEERHHFIDLHNITGLLLLVGLPIHIKRRWARMFASKRREVPQGGA